MPAGWFLKSHKATSSSTRLRQRLLKFTWLSPCKVPARITCIITETTSLFQGLRPSGHHSVDFHFFTDETLIPVFSLFFHYCLLKEYLKQFFSKVSFLMKF